MSDHMKAAPRRFLLRFHLVKSPVWTLAALLLQGVSGALAAPVVAATIAPVHSIASYIMGKTGEPQLLVPPSASPHDFAMKPSQAEMLAGSGLVIWIGPQLEGFLVKPLETIAPEKRLLTLSKLEKVKLLHVRKDEAFADDHDHGEKHEHDDHADDHDDGGHDHEKEHAAEAGLDHDHDNPSKSSYDPHIWLSLENGKAMASGIADELTRIDPQNAAVYSKNLVRFITEADTLKAELEKTLKPVAGKNFLVFHDAYQYFETEFGLAASGTFSINPEIKPGARKLRELSASLEQRDIACVFSEPQFDPKPITVLLEDNPQTSVKTAVLDPLGSTIETGPQHYFQTLEAMAQSFASCLE